MIPRELHWLFWEFDPTQLDTNAHADQILGRVLERGRFSDVKWLVENYGRRRIREFFRSGGSTEISERTRNFWRLVLHAEDEPWPTPPDFRQSSSKLWPA